MSLLQKTDSKESETVIKLSRYFDPSAADRAQEIDLDVELTSGVYVGPQRIRVATHVNQLSYNLEEAFGLDTP